MATLQSFVMLDPRNMMRNPVMVLVEVGTLLTAIVTVQSIVNHAAQGLILDQLALTFWLGITVLFTNFAEARGKAQADSLRATRQDTPAWEGRTPMAARIVQDATADHAICTTGSLSGTQGRARSFPTSSR